MIELVKEKWSSEAAEGLALALGDTLPVVGGDVQRGRCDLWRVVGYGWAVTCLEERSNGLVLVMVGGQKAENAAFCYEDSLKAFCNVAANIGAVAVEVSSHRRGIGRIVEGLGFEEVGRKYELNLEAVTNGK